MALTRTRSRVTQLESGSIVSTYLGSPAGNTHTDFKIKTDYCQDVSHDKGNDHPLKIEHLDASDLSPITGTVVNGGWTGVVTNYYPFPSTVMSHISSPTDSVSGLGLELLVRTNPSRPVVTPLTLIQDLVDIPKQLRDVGRLIRTPKRLLSAREIANQNLAIQFGWLPLIKDVQDLIKLQKHIHRRMGEIERLYSGRGLYRRVDFGDGGSEATTKTTVLSSSSTKTYVSKIQRFTYVEKWGTVRWKPLYVPRYHRTDAEIIKEIGRVCSGMTAEGLFQGAWDLIPWTWLIDWFSNASDFLKAYSNTIPAYPSHACIMRKRTTVGNFSKDPSSTCPLGGGEGLATLITKERFLGNSLLLNVSIPFISNRRLSILGSLFIQRFR